MNFKDLGINRKVLKRVNFFPTLATSDGRVVGIDLNRGENEKNDSALDTTIDLMVDYGIPLGILFTKDKMVNMILRYQAEEGSLEEDINVFEKNVEDIKKDEISELILLTEVSNVMVVEELEDNSIVIISNRYVEVD